MLNDTHETGINQLLRNARLDLHLSQQELASRLDTTTVNISRWERKVTSPGPHFRKLLCELFGKSAAELGLLKEDQTILAAHYSKQELQSENIPSLHPNSSSIWRIPYRRNPFFTGREEILFRLHNTFHTENAVASIQTQALTGLGGIGKTQAVAEYAYRFREDYSTILWIRAETHEMLFSDICSVADLLQVPERNEQDQYKIVEAVKWWLTTHNGWLLVLDNVEDFTLLEQYLPQRGEGHIVLTTRSQATGAFTHRLDLKEMEQVEGALLLLRRAKLLQPNATLEEASEALQGVAKELSQELGGLPLALDQAGAYIEESGCTLLAYKTYYQTQGVTLLDRRGRIEGKHPYSVSTTFSLCFEKVKHMNEVADDVLHLCSFLAPDAIPEELFHTDGFDLGSHLKSLASNPLAFDDAIATLRTYSLLQRDTETKTLSMHRLVQDVLKATMSEERQRQWAVQTVRIINSLFPDVQEGTTWQQCRSYFPHAQACVMLIERYIVLSFEAGQLLIKLADYEQEIGHYARAKVLLTQAETWYTRKDETDQRETMRILNIRANIYYKQHEFTKAEEICFHALAMIEQRGEQEVYYKTIFLNQRALVLQAQGKYGEAEPLFQQVLIAIEQQEENDSLALAQISDNLGLFFCEQGKYSKAEQLFKRSITIWEKLVGTEHTLYAQGIHNLAVLYIELGKYSEAQVLFEHELPIQETYLGKEHKDIATIYNNLGRICYLQQEYRDAERFVRRSLHINEKIFGTDHFRVAAGLNNLAKIFMAQELYTEAEPFLQQTLFIYERDLGQEHPYRAITLANLAMLFTEQKRWSEAEDFFQQALAIHKKTVGSEHPHVTQTLHSMALLFLKQERYEQAVSLHQSAMALQEKILGREHPTTISMQEDYYNLYQTLQERKKRKGLERTYENFPLNLYAYIPSKRRGEIYASITPAVMSNSMANPVKATIDVPHCSFHL